MGLQCELADGVKCEGCAHATPHARKGECDATPGECRRDFGRCQCVAVASMPTVAETQPTDEAEYLDCRQLAVKLNVAVKTIRKWFGANRLPGTVRISKHCVRFRKLDIEKRLLTGTLLLPLKSGSN